MLLCQKLAPTLKELYQKIKLLKLVFLWPFKILLNHFHSASKQHALPDTHTHTHTPHSLDQPSSISYWDTPQLLSTPHCLRIWVRSANPSDAPLYTFSNPPTNGIAAPPPLQLDAPTTTPHTLTATQPHHPLTAQQRRRAGGDTGAPSASSQRRWDTVTVKPLLYCGHPISRSPYTIIQPG